MSIFKSEKTTFTGARQLIDSSISDHGIAVSVSDNSAALIDPRNSENNIDISGCVILPGFADVHVHLREPGFSYKETIRTGTYAAAYGGYTDVCSMPNLRPVPDSAAHLIPQLEQIDSAAVIRVHPYGAITVNEGGEELSAMDELAPLVCAFSDDGRGVQDRAIMREAMLHAKMLGKIIAAHCEDNSLLSGGCIHAGEYASAHGIPGISSESEWRQLMRDLDLAAETGAAYHVCHISTRESVELIRQAKRSGVDVTCETAPHYLTLTENDLLDEGRFKMNPPLRTSADRDALIEGVLDGTIDMIATDHAPHSESEKSGGLRNSSMGIVGLETAFPILYTRLVRPGIVPLSRIVEMLTTAPRNRFGLWTANNDFTVFDLGTPYVIDPAKFRSMGRATPYAGETVFGRCMMTVISGKTIFCEL